MTKRRIAVVMGTRPEAIKMVPVVLALRQADWCEPCVIATAQHRELLDQVLEAFGVVPDVDLDLMRVGQGLTDLAARLLTRLEALWRPQPPDVVLVQGDTTSSFAAALAAFYLRVPVGHVEAGLRTYDRSAPFPEEMNRRLLSVVADEHFAPTERARQHLIREGVPDTRILVTGNTGIDALLWMLERIRASGFTPTALDPAIFRYPRLVLVTAHRRESFGGGLSGICAGLRTLAEVRSDAAIVYPVHPNPRVRGPVVEALGRSARIYLTDPLDYPTFVYLMSRANLILTDSGGIQEEVSSVGAPVLVMRDVTEREEAVAAGVAQLVGTSPSRIVERAQEVLSRSTPVRLASNPFGDGRAAQRIVARLRERLR